MLFFSPMIYFTICDFLLFFFFFFNDTATTEIYTLSLHDALPIFQCLHEGCRRLGRAGAGARSAGPDLHDGRSEEHTSELQSRLHLVCRLLLEKKKNKFRKFTSDYRNIISTSVVTFTNMRTALTVH